MGCGADSHPGEVLMDEIIVAIGVFLLMLILFLAAAAGAYASSLSDKEREEKWSLGSKRQGRDW